MMWTQVEAGVCGRQKMPPQQATQHGEPTPPFQQKETVQKERIQDSHLDTLLILQSPLEHPKHRSINLQIYHRRLESVP